MVCWWKPVSIGFQSNQKVLKGFICFVCLFFAFAFAFAFEALQKYWELFKLRLNQSWFNSNLVFQNLRRKEIGRNHFWIQESNSLNVLVFLPLRQELLIFFHFGEKHQDRNRKVWDCQSHLEHSYSLSLYLHFFKTAVTWAFGCINCQMQFAKWNLKKPKT